MPDVAYIALGSNLGNRDAHLAFARARLAELPGTVVLAASDVEETEALTLDGLEQPPYLNQMVAVRTDLDPRALLTELQKIEHAAGRERPARWAPRTLDLDIVLFESQVSDTADLTIPHPELPRRSFWQRELDQVKARI